MYLFNHVEFVALLATNYKNRYELFTTVFLEL